MLKVMAVMRVAQESAEDVGAGLHGAGEIGGWDIADGRWGDWGEEH